MDKTYLELMVSDPWAFGEVNGVGPFNVTVEKQKESVLLLRLEKTFDFKDRTWEYLAATPRHKGAEINDLMEGKKLHVSVILADINDEDSFGWKRYRGGTSKLIGSLSIKQDST